MKTTAANATANATVKATANPAVYPLTVLYDGACPVCNLEMDNIKARNVDGRLKFVDISAAFFDPAPYGVSTLEMNRIIYALRADGTLVAGVEVLRLAYSAVGLGHWAAPTAWPLVKPLADATYAVFARNRYGFSAIFMPVLTWLRTARAARRAVKAATACHDGACGMPQPTATQAKHT